jgi:hypothetical protein
MDQRSCGGRPLQPGTGDMEPKAYITLLKTAGQIPESIRVDEPRNAPHPSVAILILNDAFQSALRTHTPSGTCGLVEFQRYLLKSKSP